jgi:hypothetical protein
VTPSRAEGKPPPVSTGEALAGTGPPGDGSIKNYPGTALDLFHGKESFF